MVFVGGRGHRPLFKRKRDLNSWKGKARLTEQRQEKGEILPALWNHRRTKNSQLKRGQGQTACSPSQTPLKQAGTKRKQGPRTSHVLKGHPPPMEACCSSPAPGKKRKRWVSRTSGWLWGHLGALLSVLGGQAQEKPRSTHACSSCFRLQEGGGVWHKQSHR